MRADKEATAGVEPGTVMQINPAADLPMDNGRLGIVVEKQTWGVVLSVVGSHVRVTWEHVETTGGRAIWADDGTRLVDPTPPLRHHP